MYDTGLDPFTGEQVYTARNLRDRKLPHDLLQFFQPENDFEVREALLKAARTDLIGSGCDASIPASPPHAALQARMAKANRDIAEGRYVHTLPEVSAERAAKLPGSGTAGDCPGRKSSSPRPRR